MTTQSKTAGRTTPKKAEPDPVRLTMREILDRKKPVEEVFPICLDGALVDAADNAAKALRDAEALARALPDNEEVLASLARAQKAATEAAEAAREASVPFTFRAIGREKIEALERQYPASKAQLDAYRAEAKRLGRPANDPPMFDVDLFPPVLISLSVVDPAMTPEEAEELWNSESFSKGELSALLRAAWGVNNLVK